MEARVYVLFTLLVCICFETASATGDYLSNSTSTIEVAGWHLEKLATHITLSFFVGCVILLKLVYCHMGFLRTYLPISILLIGLGAIFGVVLKYVYPEYRSRWLLTPDLFFFILLPPIILESAYSLRNRTFGDRLGTILLLAVVGTTFNFLFIGFCLWGVSNASVLGFADLSFDLKACLLFSSLIVAVDPVAVLAIFEDIGVDKGLYYIVFGESLLNDAVTIVLYNIMSVFIKQRTVSGGQIVLGITSFFTISIGGLLVGVVVGILCCFITQVTRETTSLEPFIILLMGYISYILGDLFGWSGIISMIGCGLIQAAYAFHNISSKSLVVVKNTTKFLASLSEAVIFLFLGVELLSDNLVWHTGFHLWSLVLCLIARTVAVFALSFIFKLCRGGALKITYTEQFILAYGGLRGAVAFSLSVLIPAKFLGGDGDRDRNIFITGTLFVILFTVGFMGLTIKPLVKLLKIRTEKASQISLYQELNSSVFDHVMVGIEEITGEKGRHFLREYFIRLDDRYIRRFLQRDPETHSQKIVSVYEQVSLALHYATIHPERSEQYTNKLVDALKPVPSSSNLLLLEESESECTMVHEGHAEVLERPRRPTLTNPNDTVEMSSVLRKASKVSPMDSIGPYKDDKDFLENFFDQMKSRKLALKRAAQTSRKKVALKGTLRMEMNDKGSASCMSVRRKKSTPFKSHQSAVHPIIDLENGAPESVIFSAGADQDEIKDESKV